MLLQLTSWQISVAESKLGLDARGACACETVSYMVNSRVSDWPRRMVVMTREWAGVLCVCQRACSRYVWLLRFVRDGGG